MSPPHPSADVSFVSGVCRKEFDEIVVRGDRSAVGAGGVVEEVHVLDETEIIAMMMMIK